EPYLTRLTNRLLEGIERLPSDVRDRNTRYLLEAQNPDGGFSGREGGSDLYYTGFALRSLAVLQGLNENVCGKCANFLRTQMLGELDDSAKQGTADFLAALPSAFEGGLRANDRIPAADLLSTFTGGWTLDQLGLAQKLDWEQVRDYALACAKITGGFRGGLWDDRTDVEYTFYGLGTLALAALMLD